MKRYSLWVLALVLCGAAVGIAKQGVIVADQNADQNNVSGEQRVSSAAYRDGLYLGKLAAERGDSAHVATGRWARESDRTLFASGYRQAYSEIAAGSRNVVAGQPDVAAYRDGLYLGKLDSERGDAAHLAAGRWSKASHQAAFGAGYSQGYKDGDSARTAQNKLRLAQLLR